MALPAWLLLAALQLLSGARAWVGLAGTGTRSLWMGVGGQQEPLVLEGLQLVLERRSRPEHVTFARREMPTPFAVQLMRQSYAAVDKLAFVPSDEFQRSFFLFRQSEWEDYKSTYPQLMQGVLGDPLYFDHVSFCQYAVIADKMRRGKQSFVQLIDANGTAQSIQRDPLLSNNDLLPAAHSALVGDALLDYILTSYPTITPRDLPLSNQTTTSSSSSSSSSSSASGLRGLALGQQECEAFVRDAQDLLDVFQLNAYALSLKIEPLPSSSSADKSGRGPRLFAVRLVGPANLWSAQVLRKRGDLPVNDFELKVLQQLAARRGRALELVTTTVSDNARVTHVVRLR